MFQHRQNVTRLCQTTGSLKMVEVACMPDGNDALLLTFSCTVIADLQCEKGRHA